MKILIIAPPSLGGTGRVAYNLAKSLTKEGHKVWFLSYEKPFFYSQKDKIKLEIFKPLQIPIFPFPLYEISLTEAIVSLVLKHKINVIHAHYGIFHAHSLAAAKEILENKGIKVKTLITFHGKDVIGLNYQNLGKGLPLNYNFWSFSQIDHLVFVSQDLKTKFLKLYPTLSPKTKVIYNFIDLSLWQPPKQKSLKEIKILHISNFKSSKRPLWVVKIFENLQKEVKEKISLWLVGEGPEKEKVLNYLKEKEIKQVKVIKPQNGKNLVKIYQKCHILILPSIYESFSLASLEAQATGVVPIVSNSGGAKEVVKDKVSGFLIGKDNLEDFVSKTKLLIKNPQILKKMAKAGPKIASKFDSKKIVKIYLNLYSSDSKISTSSFSSTPNFSKTTFLT